MKNSALFLIFIFLLNGCSHHAASLLANRYQDVSILHQELIWNKPHTKIYTVAYQKDDCTIYDTLAYSDISYDRAWYLLNSQSLVKCDDNISIPPVAL